MWKKNPRMKIKHPSELQTSKEILPALTLVEVLLFHMYLFSMQVLQLNNLFFSFPFCNKWSPVSFFTELWVYFQSIFKTLLWLFLLSPFLLCCLIKVSEIKYINPLLPYSPAFCKSKLISSSSGEKENRRLIQSALHYLYCKNSQISNIKKNQRTELYVWVPQSRKETCFSYMRNLRRV